MTMPLVRIDLKEGKSPEYKKTIGDVIYQAMRDTLIVPENDRFQIFTDHPLSDLSIDKNYLGILRSDDCIVIQVTLNPGRSVETKQAFYKAVADGLHEKLGLRKEDVIISLVEVSSKADWSFGNGEASYVDPR